VTELPDERLIAAARTNVWDPLGDRDPRQLATGARDRDPAIAWRELAGERDAPLWSPLFHVTRRAWQRHRTTALELRVNPSRAIPPARYIDHPPTVAAAVRFSQAAVRAQRAELLARLATDRLEALGTSIAPDPIVHGARTVVWTAHAATASRQTERTALLLSKLLILALADGLMTTTLDAVGDRLAGVVVHDAWWGHRSAKCLALGALAWRELARLGRSFPPTVRDCGAKLYVSPGAVGQPIATLDDPFEPMLAMLDLGVRVVAFSDEAVAVELR
jgi:hypothetical protein